MSFAMCIKNEKTNNLLNIYAYLIIRWKNQSESTIANIFYQIMQKTL